MASEAVTKGKTLLQRLNAVQDEVDYIQKEKKPGMRYSIVSHDAVTAKVRPLMVKHGVLYFPSHIDMTQVGNRTQIAMTVTFVNIDDAEDSINVMSVGYGIDESDKGPGKAISYAVKYALLKTLGLETGDDPDHDQDVAFKGGGERRPFDPVTYPNPPLRSSGLPQAGYRKDGARTAHSLKRDQPDDWPDFERELNEVVTVPRLTRLAFDWSAKSTTELWPPDWRELARERINQRRQEILNTVVEDNDDFPGDR